MNDKYLSARVVVEWLERVIYGADPKIEKWVDVMPAADVVPVRHGRWWWDGYVYDMPWQCSECRCFSDTESNYCPNCGARMDGDGE